MEVAVARLITAIENDEKIAIFGDYDVDGGCATALLIRYFRSIGVEALLYIPDRMTEGYGPNEDAMDSIKSMGADVVITVEPELVIDDGSDGSDGGSGGGGGKNINKI